MRLEDVDLTDAARYEQGVPHDAFRVLRTEAPVYRHPEREGPGFWAVTRHDDIVHVSKRPDLFSSHRGGTNLFDVPAADLEITRSLLINMDPPQHVKFRRLVRQGFTPNRVRVLLPRVRARAARLVDTLVEKGECDFVREVAAELPLQVIAELMGIPEDDRGRIFDLSNRLIGFDDPEFQNSFEDGKQAAAEMWLYAHKLAVERKSGRGRGPRQRADALRSRRPPNLGARVQQLLPAARRGGQRDHAEPALRRRAGADRAPRPVAAPAPRPLAPRHRGRGVPALGDAGHALPAHRHPRRRAPRASRSARATRS